MSNNKLYKLPNHIFIGSSLIKHAGKGLFTNRKIKKNSIVYKYDTIDWPKNKSGTYKRSLDLQLFDKDNNKFKFKINKIDHSEYNVNGTLDFTGFDMLINHSCNFNCYYDRDMKTLRAYKDIKKGEELYLNYNLSSYDYKIEHNVMYKCNCNSNNCIKKIKGYKYLNDNIKRKLLDFTNLYVLNKVLNI
jgi:SET domain-containing protein